MRQISVFQRFIRKNHKRTAALFLSFGMLMAMLVPAMLFTVRGTGESVNLLAGKEPIEFYISGADSINTPANLYTKSAAGSRNGSTAAPAAGEMLFLTDGNDAYNINAAYGSAATNGEALRFPNADWQTGGKCLVLIYDVGESPRTLTSIRLAGQTAAGRVGAVRFYAGNDLTSLFAANNRVDTFNDAELSDASGVAGQQLANLSARYVAFVITKAVVTGQSAYHLTRVTELSACGQLPPASANVLAGTEPIEFYISGADSINTPANLYTKSAAGSRNGSTAAPAAGELLFLTDGNDTYNANVAYGTAPTNGEALRFPNADWQTGGKCLVLIYDTGSVHDLTSIRLAGQTGAGRVGAVRFYAGNDLASIFAANNRVDAFNDAELSDASGVAGQQLANLSARYVAFVITKAVVTGQGAYHLTRVTELSAYGTPAASATHSVALSVVDEYRQEFPNACATTLPGSAQEGGDLVFEVTPAAGYQIVSVTANDVALIAGSDGKYTVPSVAQPQNIVVTVHEDELQSKNIRILTIGNSFSQDAMEHLYQLAKNAGAEQVVLGYLYLAGCSLETHWNNAENNLSAYTYYKNSGGSWSTSVSTMLEGIKDEVWNVIVLQQAPAESGMESTYNSDLDHLITYVNANKIKTTAKLAWHMTWAYQENCDREDFGTFNNSQMTMYNAIVSAVQNKIATNSEIDLILPVGTAIQNLRTSFTGDTLTRDGYHLSLYIGRYAASMTWLRALGWNIDGITYVPNETEIPESYLPAIKEAANNAAQTPFAVTDSAYTQIHAITSSVVNEQGNRIVHGATIHSLPQFAVDGGSFRFSITLFPGYSIVSVKANGTALTAGGDGKYTVSGVTSAQSIVITLHADGTQAPESLIADDVPVGYYVTTAGAATHPERLYQISEPGKFNISNTASPATDALLKTLTDGLFATNNLYYKAADQQAGKCLVLIYDLKEVCKLSGIKFTGESGTWRVGNIRMYAGIDLAALLNSENRVDTLGEQDIDATGIVYQELAEKEACYIAVVITRDVTQSQIDAGGRQYNMARVREIEVYGEQTGQFAVSAQASEDFAFVIADRFIERNGSTTFTLRKKGCYGVDEVKANGIVLTPANGVYTVSNVTGNVTLTVTKGGIENNLIAGKPLTRYYAVDRKDYLTPNTMIAVTAGDRDTTLTDGSIANDNRFRISTSGNPDGNMVTAGSKCIVLIYHLGGIADVSDIYFASTNEANYQVAGYDYFISDSLNGILSQGNLIYTSNGNALTADEELDPDTSLVVREKNVHFDDVKRGRYVAVVITRPHSTTIRGYNMARISEISICGTLVSEDIIPNMHFSDSATGVSLTFSTLAPDLALEFGKLDAQSIRIEWLPLSDITKLALQKAQCVPVSRMLRVRLYNTAGNLIPKEALRPYQCLLSIPTSDTRYQFWNYIQEEIPILVNNSSTADGAITGYINDVYGDYVAARFAASAAELPGLNLDGNTSNPGGNGPDTGDRKTDILWILIICAGAAVLVGLSGTHKKPDLFY